MRVFLYGDARVFFKCEAVRMFASQENLFAPRK